MNWRLLWGFFLVGAPLVVIVVALWFAIGWITLPIVAFAAVVMWMFATGISILIDHNCL